MGATCSFVLNGQVMSWLTCDGVRYTAFSGSGADRNNPESEAIANSGPIPLGRYYIVDRQSGGTLGGLRDFVSGRNRWFALYRDDGTVDDQTFVHSVRRGEFRLHPLGPSGVSIGCIVLQYPSEFTALQSYLRGLSVEYIPGTGIRTYGIVEVERRQLIDTLDPRFRPRRGASASSSGVA